MSKFQLWKDPKGKTTTKVNLGETREPTTKRRAVVDEEEQPTGPVEDKKSSTEKQTDAARREIVPVATLRRTNIAQGYMFSNLPFYTTRAHQLPNPFRVIDRAALALHNGFGTVMTQQSYSNEGVYGSFGKALIQDDFLVTHGPAHLHHNRDRLCNGAGLRNCDGLALAVNGVVGAPIKLIAETCVNITFKGSRSATRTFGINDGLILTTDCIGGNPRCPMNILANNDLEAYPGDVPNLAPKPLPHTDAILRDDTRCITVLRDWAYLPALYLVETSACLTGVQVQVFLPGDENCE